MNKRERHGEFIMALGTHNPRLNRYSDGGRAIGSPRLKPARMDRDSIARRLWRGIVTRREVVAQGERIMASGRPLSAVPRKRQASRTDPKWDQ